jgi:hypothetical protein
LGESVLLAAGNGGHLDIVDWASAKGCLPWGGLKSRRLDKKNTRAITIYSVFIYLLYSYSAASTRTRFISCFWLEVLEAELFEIRFFDGCWSEQLSWLTRGHVRQAMSKTMKSKHMSGLVIN